MKNGFTLIEIIIVVVLVTLIGTSTTIILIKKNQNNIEQEEVFKKLVEAASVYLSVEKDEDGITYERGLLSGGTGVTIPVKVLKESGYINDNIIKTLEKNNKFNINNSYLLASFFTNEDSECKNNDMIEFNGSWNVSTTKPMYICPKGENIPECSTPETPSGCPVTYGDSLINTILKQEEKYGIKEIENITVEDYNSDYMLTGGYSFYLHEPTEEGFFKFKDIYFYRGIITNNYVKINGYPYRILNFNENKKTIKLLDENTLIKQYYDEATGYELFSGNEFTKTKIYNAIVYAYMMHFTSIDGFEGILTDGDFCIGGSGSNLNDLIKNCEEFSSQYGLITYPEAIMSGIYLITYPYASSGYERTWLGDSKSTIILEENLQIKNEFTNGLGSSYRGYISYIDSDNIATSIRPVIVVNDDKLKVGSGMGTKRDPYVLEPK